MQRWKNKLLLVSVAVVLPNLGWAGVVSPLAQQFPCSAPGHWHKGKVPPKFTTSVTSYYCSPSSGSNVMAKCSLPESYGSSQNLGIGFGTPGSYSYSKGQPCGNAFPNSKSCASCYMQHYMPPQAALCSQQKGWTSSGSNPQYGNVYSCQGLYCHSNFFGKNLGITNSANPGSGGAYPCGISPATPSKMPSSCMNCFNNHYLSNYPNPY